MRILIGICLIFFTACEESDIFNSSSQSDIQSVAESEISFSYRLANSDDNSLHYFSSKQVLSRSSGWYFMNEDLDLVRAISLGDSMLEGKIQGIEVTLWMRKRGEDTTLLLLENNDKLYYQRDWDYKSYRTEASNFYRNFTDARLEVNGKVMFNSDSSNSIEVIKVRRVLAEGKDKTWVEIRFTGSAFGFYDPFKEYTGYIVSGGVFRGVVE